MEETDKDSPEEILVSMESLPDQGTRHSQQAVGAVRGGALRDLRRNPMDRGRHVRPARQLNRAFYRLG